MDISKALQYLHTRGIVHGHLSPFNAMLSNDEEGIGKLRLMDFGLSRRIGNGQRGRSMRNAGLCGSGGSVGRAGNQELGFVLPWNFDVSAADPKASV